MARRLDDGELVDPYGGEPDLRERLLRTVSREQLRRGSAADRARAALRLAVRSRPRPARRCSRCATRRRRCASSRVSGSAAGSRRTGWGSCRSSCSARTRRRRFGSPATRACSSQLLPELEPAIGFDQESRYHALTVDEHTFAVVQAAADAGTPLRVRLAALFHDAGKPQVAWRGTDGRLHYYAKPGYATKSHEQVECRARRRGAQPAALPDRAAQASRAHRARAHVRPGRRRRAARAPAARAVRRQPRVRPPRPQGGRPARQGRPARGRTSSTGSHAFACVLEQEQASPHRLRDLAVDGDDLIALGYKPGPEIGRTLQALLHEVVRDPSLNTREQLLERARGAALVIRWDEPGYVVAFTTRARRRQRGAVRLAQPDARNRRRAPSASRRTGGSRVSRSACPPSGSPSTGRCIRRPCIARRQGCAASRATGSGRTSRTCRCSRCPPTASRSPSRAPTAGRARSQSCTRAGAGSRKGSSQAGVAALGPGEKAAVIGPAIGPCCYEVGTEVSDALRRRPDARRQARSLVRGRARASHARASARVERLDLCTRDHPELFFSHRRDGRARGVQGVIGAVA